MSARIVLIASLAYESILFGIAWFGRNSRDFRQSTSHIRVSPNSSALPSARFHRFRNVLNAPASKWPCK